MTVQSQTGLTYTLESVSDLSAANWTAVYSLIGTGGPLTLSDTNATTGARFYRVKVQ
ncbi:MAG: hypothetical protein ACYDH9_03245 [Limisphaerales bacterium]